nr:immunoglobulin heavy chain junction region [Mus musculus]
CGRIRSLDSYFDYW